MNKTILNILSSAACAAVIMSAAFPAAAASYRAVYFVSGQDQQPLGIIEGAPGLFYFESGAAVVLAVTTQGAATTLTSFPNRYGVQSTPGTTAANGLVYSSVDYVGSTGYYVGSIFSVGSTAGSEHTYPAQSVVAGPLAGNLPNGKLFALVFDVSSGLYNLGTSDLNGKVTTFYQFPSTSEQPATPIYAADGNYYGISYPHVSGSTDYFYRVTPSGTFTKLASLPFTGTQNGSWLGGGLILQATDGNFYGIQPTDTGCSSSNQHGAVFKLTPSGQFTILHDFGVCGNGIVNSLIQASDGKLWGAQGNSVLFSLTTSGTYKVEFRPTNPSAQGLCSCVLVQGSDGNIYGTATGGGPTGAGVIFALNAGLPVPKPRAHQFYPASGPVGTHVRIWGYNLFGASVQFNGAAATGVHSAGPNYVWATVPAGATTGPITVTTPGGTFTTKSSFTVQ
jgi:uncharacterized repeat protein (TIGR03803 family)